MSGFQDLRAFEGFGLDGTVALYGRVCWRSSLGQGLKRLLAF